MRWLNATFGLICLLLVTLYLTLPWLVAPVARLVAPDNVEIKELAVLRPTLSQLSVARFHFNVTSDSKLSELRGEDWHIDLSNWSAISLAGERLEILYKTIDGGASKSAPHTIPGITQSLPTIPVTEVDIASFTLTSDVASGKRLAGTLIQNLHLRNLNDTSYQVTGQWLNASAPYPLTLDIKLNESLVRQLDIVIGNGTDVLLRAEAALAPLETDEYQLHLLVDGQLPFINAVFEQFDTSLLPRTFGPPDMQAGHLRGEARFAANVLSFYNPKSWLNLDSDLQLDDFSVKVKDALDLQGSLSLQVRGNPSAHRYQLLPIGQVQVSLAPNLLQPKIDDWIDRWPLLAQSNWQTLIDLYRWQVKLEHLDDKERWIQLNLDQQGIIDMSVPVGIRLSNTSQRAAMETRFDNLEIGRWHPAQGLPETLSASWSSELSQADSQPFKANSNELQFSGVIKQVAFDAIVNKAAMKTSVHIKNARLKAGDVELLRTIQGQSIALSTDQLDLAAEQSWLIESTLSNDNRVSLTAYRGAAAQTIAAGTLKLSTPERPQPLRLSWQQARLHTALAGSPEGVRDKNFSGEIQYQIDGLGVTHSDIDLTEAELTGRATVSSTAVNSRGRWRLSPEDSWNPFSLNHSISGVESLLRLPSFTLSAARMDQVGRPLLKAIDQEVKLSSGEISGAGEFRVTPNGFSSNILVQSHKIALNIDDMSLRDIELDVVIDGLDPPKIRGKLAIPVARLAMGAEIGNAKTAFETIGGNHTLLENISADLLGGRLATPQLEWRNGSVPLSNFQLHRLDLTRLFGVLNIDGLSGSGRLNLTIPFRYGNSRIAVENGTLRSEGPGLLRYESQNLGAGGGNLAMRALRNFHYESMTGEWSYREDGDLGHYVAQVKLSGHNPDLYDGHPIVFNLNLDGRLPGLFTELFLTGDIGDTLLRKYRENSLESDTKR